MARIFLAEDVTLEREVVVKVLSPHLVDDTLIKRFRNEVFQTARLQHPTIVSVFDVGQLVMEDGREVPFYIMPYVRGESLRSRLQHEGSLSVSATVRILRSVLDALVYAHAHGVVHRDIKPENIFLSGSNAVLADFGIAKAVAGPRKDVSLTSPGSTVGTPAYMASEQLAGDETIDHRADLYSVGVVAYEALAGRLPWKGGTPSEVLASQARGAIVPLRSLRSDVPVELAAAIEKCLSWDPAKRPDSAVIVMRSIESLSFTPSTPTSVVAQKFSGPAMRWTRAHALAVTAIVVVLAAAAGAWALGPRSARAHGMVRLAVLYPDLDAKTAADSTLNEQVYHILVSSLHPVLGLELAGEISVPDMYEKGIKPEQIADSLHVDSLLVLLTTPSMNGQLLLQAELRERKENRQTIVGVVGPASLASLEGLTPDSVQTLLHLLSAQVATRLGLTSGSTEVSTTQKTEAWIAWSKGRDASATRTPKGIMDAIRWYERAVSLDSNYAQAAADLSLAMSNAMWYRYRADESPVMLATTALRLANRAVALRPNFADGYLARGYIGVLAGAPLSYLEENYGTVERLTSSNPFSKLWLVGLLAARGKMEDAVARLAEEVSRDPGSPAPHITLALYALGATQYATAVRSARRAHALAPGIPLTSSLELQALLAMGESAKDQCMEVEAGPYLGARALCLEHAGHPREAAMLVDSLISIITGRSAMDSTFDLSLYVSEMALYAGAHRERVDTDQWLRQVFRESPSGIDFRLMRVPHFFTKEMVALSDTLRGEVWRKVQMAASGKSLASLVRP